MKSTNPLGAAQAITGLLIAATPFVLPACAELLETKMGTTVPMTCHWTAQAEIALGVIIAIVGLIRFAFAQYAETRSTLDTVVLTLGATVILIPTVLIGTCAVPTHTCNIGMRPALLLLGSLAIILGGGGLLGAWRGSRRAPLAAG